jgi:hypothetical protein
MPERASDFSWASFGHDADQIPVSLRIDGWSIVEESLDACDPASDIRRR